MGRILVVDDNPRIHQDFRKILAFTGDSQELALVEVELFGAPVEQESSSTFQVDVAHQGEHALRMVERASAEGNPYAVLFTDVRMPPGWDGVQTAQAVWRVDPTIQIVLCTAYSDYTWEDIFRQLGPGDNYLILKKPFDSIEVRQIAHTLSAKWHLTREREQHLRSLEEQVHTRTEQLERANRELRREMEARVRWERELRHTRKLEALGRLAAGIGHEINNPLAYVITNIDFAREALDELEFEPRDRVREIREGLNEAADGAQRIRRIVRDIRGFARPTEGNPSPIDVHQSLRAAVRMVQGELRHRAELVFHLDRIPLVLADPPRLEQVFVNLLMNAIQALPETSNHSQEISVSTSCPTADQVEISIADTGEGIPSSDRERIFEPFFSTRPLGKGTGLGLWICRSIVESFGGRLEVESQLGEGTVARVLLPPADGSPRRTRRPGETEPCVPRSRYHARLLIIDDEPAVLRGLGRSLRQHDTVLCSDPEQAWARYQTEQFDLVLCDLLMPKMSGMDFYARLQALGPTHTDRMILMTGGTVTDASREFLAHVENPCLIKPFDFEELTNAIAERLQFLCAPTSDH